MDAHWVVVHNTAELRWGHGVTEAEKPNTEKKPRESPNSTINPVKDLFEDECVCVCVCMCVCVCVCVCVCTCVSRPTFRKALPNTDPCKVISPPRTSLLCVLMATSQTLSSSLPGLPTTHTNSCRYTHMLHRHTHTHTYKQNTTWLPCSVGGPEEPRHQSINSGRSDCAVPGVRRSYYNWLLSSCWHYLLYCSWGHELFQMQHFHHSFLCLLIWNYSTFLFYISSTCQKILSPDVGCQS